MKNVAISMLVAAIVVWFICRGMVASAPMVYEVPLARGDGSFLSASIHLEENAKKKKLVPKAHEEIDAPSKVLEAFFFHAKAGERQRLIALSYAGDGSRERMTASLEREPDRFQGFQNLKRVDVQAIGYYGPYTMIHVSLQSDRSEVDWVYSVICREEGCFLSDYTETLAWDARLFGHLLYTSGDREQAGLGEAKAHSPDALMIDVLPDAPGGKSHPMALAIGMEPIAQIVRFDEPTSSSSREEPYGELIAELREMRALPTDRRDGISLLAAEEYFASQFAGYRQGDLIDVFFCGDGESEVKRKKYTALAFSQRLKHWDHIELIGAIEAEGFEYVFYLPYRGEQRQCVQVLPLSRSRLAFNGRSNIVWTLLSGDDVVKAVMKAQQ